MGATTVKVGKIGATFRAATLPVLRGEPEHGDGSVRFRQTVGGRTALPLPRPVPHPPYVRWQAPLVWTTLVVTLRADGTSDVELTGASAFPRHWVYDATGRIVLKSGLADQGGWMAHSFGERTPWADHDREALVVAVESELERQLSTDIMQGGERPEIRNLQEGAQLTKQGDPGDELYLVLDGVVRVDVDGRALAELGPGAVIGERALLEGGTRTSTVTAITPLRVAVASRDRHRPRPPPHPRRVPPPRGPGRSRLTRRTPPGSYSRSYGRRTKTSVGALSKPWGRTTEAGGRPQTVGRACRNHAAVRRDANPATPDVVEHVETFAKRWTVETQGPYDEREPDPRWSSSERSEWTVETGRSDQGTPQARRSRSNRPSINASRFSRDHPWTCFSMAMRLGDRVEPSAQTSSTGRRRCVYLAPSVSELCWKTRRSMLMVLPT